MVLTRAFSLLLLLGIAQLLSPVVLQAQSVLHFPRVISNSSFFTGVAVGNPTTSEVSVTFTAFQPDGTPFAGDGMQNPITVKIPAGGQMAKLFSEIFSTREFNGWVQATSSTRGLTGFFINGNGQLTDLDGTGAIEAGTEFVLPFASEDTTTRTEVTLVNVNAEAATAIITLHNADGQAVATKDLPLAARGLVRQTLRGIFGDVDLTNVSHAKVRSERPLVGHEVVADYLIAGSTLRRETIALSGQRPTAATTYVLPQFATGGGWLSLIGLVNAGGVGQEVTLTAYKEDGTVWNVPSNPKRVSLEGNGALRITAGELFGFPAETLSTGWIEVKGSVGFLSSYIGFGNTLTPSFALVGASELGAAARYEVFSQVAEGAGFFTGLTVVNPGRETANVEFYTLRPDGTTVGRSTFAVGANQRVGKLFSELLPASLEQVGGWAFLRSSQPVIAAVLFGSTNGFALANVPQQIPAGDFIPPAQTTGSISGAVRAAGEGVGGVQIQLSGPVTATRQTDSLGRYTFPQLPNGEYKVTPARVGAGAFAPIEQTITINRDNRNGVDFEGGSLVPAVSPTISFVTPASTFAGSNRQLNVRILGSNFTPTSRVLLNDQPVDLVVFVNAAELQAVVPAARLAQAGTLRVTVQTPPPGGGVSNRLDFTVNAVPTNPLIERIQVPVGGHPAGVAIDSTRQRALISNESTDTVTVVDLKTFETVATISVGRSPSENIAIHPGRNIALVPNIGSDNVSVIDLRTNQEIQKITVGDFPTGVAINPNTNRALVTSRTENNVRVIDLDNFSTVATIQVGTRPLNVAVQPRFNRAIVTNSGSNNVSIIDLNTNTVVNTINVGTFPRGVAINIGTNVAVVANANSNNVSVIDLNGNATLAFTAEVKAGPTGVAFHELTNTAIITNSSVVNASTNFGVASSVSVLFIGTRTVVQEIEVGSAAYGIAIDEETQRAVVANFGSNSVSVLRVPNPRPRVDTVEPRTFPAGTATFTITVRGVGFVPTSLVTLNGQTLPTTFVSSTELRAQVTAEMLQQLLQVRRLEIDGDGKSGVFKQVTELNFNVNVTNPEPGGGEAPPPTDTTVTKITPQNAAPVLISISPTEIQSGTGPLTLTLNGNGFNATSVIAFGGTPHSPTTSSPTQMTLTLPASALTPGTFPVSVTNPPPGGGTTAAIPFTVNAQANAAPGFVGINPPTIPAGSGPATVTVQASSLIAATTATLGGVNGSISGNTITFSLPAAQTAEPGTLNGLITTPPPGGGSASFVLNVVSVAPTITGATPPTAEAGSSGVKISVTGTNFRQGSQILIEGTPVIDTVFESSTQLSAIVPEAYLRRAAVVRIGVRNPPPGGGTAEGPTFTITSAVPVLTSVNPARVPIQITAQTDFQVQLRGSGFAGNSVASIGSTRLTTIFDSATQLTVTIPAALMGRAAVHEIIVTSPPPGGGVSQAVQLSLENPVPVVDSLTPLRFRGDQRDVVLIFTGRNFVQGATVRIGEKSYTPSAVSATQVSVPLPPPVPLGRQSVTVLNPQPGGGASNAIEIEVTALLPVITAVTPEVVGLGQTIRVTGSNFGPGSTIHVRGLAAVTRTITEGDSIVLEAMVPPTLAVGTAEVTVRNPSTTNEILQSAPVSITIANPPPAISSFDPPSALASHTGQRITIKGTGFIPASQVHVDGNAVTATYVDPTTLTFTLPLITRTSAAIQVINAAPGGGTASATFPLTFLPPTITAIIPISGTAGTTVPLSVSGTNFVDGAVIRLGETSITTTFLSSTSLFASVALPSTAGSVLITVANPGGAVSNAFNFTITAPAPPPVIVAPPPPPPPPPPPVPTLNAVSIQPGQGSSGRLHLTGTNFVPGATTITSSATGFLITSFSATSSTEATAFGVASVPPGNYTFTVSTANGTSNAITIPVTESPLNAATQFFVSRAAGSSAGDPGDADGAGINARFRFPEGFWADQEYGYIADAGNHTIRRISEGLSVATFAGSAGVSGTADGSGSSARFNSPHGLWGNGVFMFVADFGSHSIRKVDLATGAVSTFAGTAGVAGTTDAAGTLASFKSPFGLWGDAKHLYVADYGSHTIRKIVIATGEVTTFAGSAGTAGSADGIGVAAQFNCPAGLAGDGTYLYVADSGNHTIRRVSLATGEVSTIAGTAGESGVADGTGNAARFKAAAGLWTDGSNLFITDTGNHTIRRLVIATGAVTTLAGSAGTSGRDDGTAPNARFSTPIAILGNAERLGVLDAGSNGVRVIRPIFTPQLTAIAPNSGLAGTNFSVTLTGQHLAEPSLFISAGSGISLSSVNIVNSTQIQMTFNIGQNASPGVRPITVSTAAGTSNALSFTVNAPPASAPTLTSLSPSALTRGQSGTVALSGTGFVGGATAISVAGTGITVSSVSVSSSTAMSANFSVASDAASGARAVTVSTASGTSNSVNLTIESGGVTLTSISPSNGVQGGTMKVTLTGTNFMPGATFIAIGGSGMIASLNTVTSTTATAFLNLNGPPGNYPITVSTAAGTSNPQTFVINGNSLSGATLFHVGRLAGGPSGEPGATDGAGTSARFHSPEVVWGDGTNLYISDVSNGTIRRIQLAGTAVTTIAGSAGLFGDTDGVGTAARFFGINGTTGDGDNLYLTDYAKHTLRKMVLSTGAVTTIAGASGVSGSTNGAGAAARFNTPYGLWGNGTDIYIAEGGSHVIRRFNLATGQVSIFAGAAGVSGSADGAANVARFNGPIDVWGNGTHLFVVERGNHTIRRVSLADGSVATLAGTALSSGSTDGTGPAARFNKPTALWGDGTHLYVVDADNYVIRRVVIGSGQVTTVAGKVGTSGNQDGPGADGRFGYPVAIWGNGHMLYVADASNNSIRILVPVTVPALTTISPANGARGTSVSVTLTGSSFTPGATTVIASGSGVTATNVNVANSTSLTATFTIAADAPLGGRSITVYTMGGTSNSVTFTVDPSVTPTISTLVPAQRVVNSGGFTLDIFGTNFASGTKVVFGGTTYTATFIDAQHVVANIAGSDITALGDVAVKVQVPDSATFIDSNAFTFKVIAPAITLSPNPVSANVGGTTPVTVSVNQAVTASGGIDVAVTSASPSVATVTSPAHISQGETAATVMVTGIAVGSSALTASLAGYTSGSTMVNVTATAQPLINITPTTLIMSAAGSAVVTISRANSSNAVPLTVSLAVNRAGFFNFPATVTIPSGQDNVTATLTGITADGTPPVVLSGSAAGHISGSTSQITVKILRIQMTPAVLVNPGQTTNIQVVLSDPAPAGGLTINFNTSAPSTATVTPSITIAAGNTQGSAVVTGVTAGNATITASAAGFPNTTSSVQVQNINLSFVPSTATFLTGSSYARTVTLTMNVAALDGGQLVNLASSDTSLATVPATVTVPSGASAVNVTVTGVGPGVATITASSPGLNSGTFTATLIAPTFKVNDSEGAMTTATGIRRLHYVRTSHIAPIGGIPLTITSSDPTRLKVAPCNTTDPQDTTCNHSGSPQDSVTLTVPTAENYVRFDIIGQDAALDEVRLSDPIGVVRDSAGNVYIAEYGQHIIRKIDGATGIVSRFAGTGAAGNTGDGGLATDATLSGPTGMAIHNNELYIAMYNQGVIRKINLGTNVISSVGPGGLQNPYQVAFNAAGDLFIASWSGRKVLKFSGGVLTTVVGGGTAAATTVDVAATTLNAGNIPSVAVDDAGNIYYSDASNHIINQVDTSGVVRRVAGTGTAGESGDLADAKNAQLRNPYGVAVDKARRLLYIIDYGNARILKVTLDSTQPSSNPQPIVRIAGDGNNGCCEDGLNARFSKINSPTQLAVDANGNILIGDRSNNRVREITFATGTIDTLIGSGTDGGTGDGQPARGVHLIITGPSFITKRVPVDINQSTWQIISLTTTQTLGVPFNFTVRQSSNERMADSTTVTMTPLSPFTLNSPLTININGQTATGTATPTSAGSGRIRIEANGTRFATFTSDVVTVLPAATAAMLISDSRGRLDTATGVRRRHYVRLPAAAPAGGVSVTVSVNPAGSVKVGLCNPTDPNDSTCTGAALGDSVNLTIPQGQNYSYFDVAGQAAAFTNTQTNDPIAVHYAANGDLYFAEFGNYRVRKLSAAGILSTIAGTGATTAVSGIPGAATSAVIKRPISVATDSAGNVYIAAYDGYVILKVDTAGNISTVAGIANSPGNINGALGTNKLSTLYQVAVGPDDSLYVADYGNARVRKLTGGVLSTIAGGGSGATAALQYSFNGVAGVAVDPATSDVYVAEQNGHKIWRIVQSTGAMELVAGTGSVGFNGDQADATTASVYSPAQLHIRGNYLYFADYNNHRIRRIQLNVNPRPIVTMAGTTSAGFSGDGDLAVVAQLNGPWGVTTDPDGNLYVAERDNARIRKVLASNSKIGTIIGSGDSGFAGDGGGGRGVTLRAVVNTAGIDYLAAENSVRVLQSQWQLTNLGTAQSTVTPFTFQVRQSSGDRMAADTTVNLVSTGPFTLTTPLTITNNNSAVTGTATPTGGGSGQIQVQATGTSFSATNSAVIIVTPPITPPLLISDTRGRIETATGIRRRHYIRLPATAGAGGVSVTVTVSPTGSVKVGHCNASDPNDSNCTGATLGDSVTLTIPQGTNYSYFDVAGQAASFSNTQTNDPIAVHYAANGDLYFAEFGNYRVRKLSAAGILSTVAGTGATSNISGVPGPATSAVIKRPIGLATDSTGNLYIASYDGYAILKVDASGNMSTVAGIPSSPGNVDGALGTGKLSTLYQVAVGPDDSLYVADYGNARVRKVMGGVLSTIAGGGSGATPALQQTFSGVAGVAVDPATGDVYIAEQNAHKIWRVVQSTGAIDLVAGTGASGFNGDQGDATLAQVASPAQLHIRGNFLYFADYNNARIRRIQINVNPRPIVTVAGTTSAGFSGDGDQAIVAQLSGPWGVSTDPAGNIYIAERDNARIRKVLVSNSTINTLIGSGDAGFAGDGGGGRGVTLRAVVNTSGVNYLPAENSIRVAQSQWQIQSLGTGQLTTTPFTFTLRQSSGDRMAADTNLTLVSTGPFTLTTPLTIANNGTSVTATGTPTGSGSGLVQVQATGTSFSGVTSDVITVLPPAVPGLSINDSLGARVTATGVRNRTYVRLPATAGAGGVTVNVTSSDASRVAVATCNTTNYQDGDCTGGFPGAGITLNIPQGQNYAYFDLVGLTSAFSDTRTNDPIGVHMDASGNLYIAEFGNYRVRKLSSAGVLSTVAGNGGTGAISGVPGSATSATIRRPISVVTDASGNLYIASYDGYAILMVDPSGNISTVAGVLNSPGSAEGALGTGKLSTLYQVALGPDNSLYIADYGNAKVRKLTGGVLSTIAGGGSGATAALQKTFNGVAGIAVDPATSDVYVAEQNANRIWRVVQSTGAIELVAGTGAAGFNGDQADATAAEIDSPAQLHIRGNYLYFADYDNARVRRIQINVTPRPIVTIGGTTSGGFSGDGDQAIVARLSGPWGVTTDADSNVYIAERNNERIRKITNTDGKISTHVFSGTNGFAGDGGTARGVTIRAEVAAGGPTYLPAVVSARVNQSSWQVFNFITPNSGPTFGFNVRQTASELTAARASQDTTFSLLSTNTQVFTLPAQVTISNNQAEAVVSGTTVGAGLSQIVAQSSATGIAQGSSSNITIEAVITSALPSSGPTNTTTPVVLSGRNLNTATGVTAPSGITATITGGSTTALNVNIQVGSGVTAGAKTLTLQTPGGNVNFTFTVN